MADAKHLTYLLNGGDIWNAWRKTKRRARPDLRGADLRGANLEGADLSGADLGQARLSSAKLYYANLRGANLSGVNLLGAGLAEADLSGANLSGVILRDAELYKANLRGADLSGATLREADLSEADLERADLRRATLYEADLRRARLFGADLEGANFEGANLEETYLFGANLMQANLIDVCLDGANLTGAKLWEIQRTGWSIKNVICRAAFWERDGKEPTKYEEGEFECIFTEKPRIVLRYPGGMSLIDLIALPVEVARLQADHPGSTLQIRSIQNDAGGASVTITAEDRDNRSTELFAAELEKLRTDLVTMRYRFQNEEKLRLSFEAQCQILVERVIPTLAAAPKQQVNIGQLTGPTTIEGVAMSRDTYNIPGQAGAVGPGAHAEKNTFQQIQAGIDLPKLADELGRLRGAMKSEATGTREQDKAIGAVADAEEAAAKGDGQAVLQYLKSAGKWTLGIAEKIGVPVVIEALKRAM
ncbi:MAG: pentapeptide repeat-containing protein [Rhodopila sp.]